MVLVIQMVQVDQVLVELAAEELVEVKLLLQMVQLTLVAVVVELVEMVDIMEELVEKV